jgi:hypothetical protein
MTRFMVGMCFVCLVFGMTSCGSSSSGGGSDTAKAAAEDSFDGFGEVLDSDDVEACWIGTATSCDCPGGGTLEVDADDGIAVTMDGCTSSDGLVYSGTLTMDDDYVINGNMAQFGECSNVTASNISGDDCTGSSSGTCAGESYTCNLTSDGDDGCDCQ